MSYNVTSYIFEFHVVNDVCISHNDSTNILFDWSNSELDRMIFNSMANLQRRVLALAVRFTRIHFFKTNNSQPHNNNYIIIQCKSTEQYNECGRVHLLLYM